MIDYKTGSVTSQKNVAESPPAQHLRARLARRPRLGHARAGDTQLHESVTRISTTGTDEELDFAWDSLAPWVSCARSGNFAVTPSAATCRWCDYAALCPSRAAI